MGGDRPSMTIRGAHLVLLGMGVLLLHACTGPNSGDLVTSGPIGETSVAPARSAPAPGLQPDGTYVLGPNEMALSCRELSGRTLVRILEIRDYELSRSGSIAARSLQKAVTPIFGGTQRGADPEADYRHDRAMVEAYNRRLAEKGCKTFDLSKELQPKPAAEEPILVKK